MIKLGTNILSQKVQRNLGRATTDLSTTSERLASGMRINKASDDAAGLAIAASLNADTRIFTQGIRNLNDGLSAGNIAEGAMEQLGNIIIRIEELSTQSANGTYSDVQRGSLQKEATALVAEWNRIVESTSFNGRDLLTGSSTRTVLQGGKGSEGTLAVQVGAEQLTGGILGYAGGTTRVSVSSIGSQALGGSSSPNGISADGRYIIIQSSATNLVTGDTNSLSDVFLHDSQLGTTTRVSVSTSGAEGNGISFFGDISADGRYVAFLSQASNLISGDSNTFQDAFIRDLSTGVTSIVSTSSTGSLGNDGAGAVVISGDGRYVAIDSYASNLVVGDSNLTVDVFLKDTVTGAVSLLSTSTSGVQGDDQSFVNDISADGRYVAFSSNATTLVTGDTNASRDAFVRDTFTGVTTRVSTSSSGAQASGYSRAHGISADGRYVAFWSDANNLVSGDTNNKQDSFIKDMVTGITTRISTDSAGIEGNGDSRVSSISADGRFVVFESDANNLVANDTNNLFDSFVKDTLTGLTIRISTSSSGEEGNSLSYGAILSADGRKVVFRSTASNLVSGDTNTQDDTFIRDLTRTGVQQLSGIVVSNKVSAKITLDLVQKYRAELLDYRSKIGASTSRISTFVNTLQSSTINYKAASSRITDADIAEESSKSIAARIRQEVATSLLGQANQAPQIALSLLRGA